MVLKKNIKAYQGQIQNIRILKSNYVDISYHETLNDRTSWKQL